MVESKHKSAQAMPNSLSYESTLRDVKHLRCILTHIKASTNIPRTNSYQLIEKRSHLPNLSK